MNSKDISKRLIELSGKYSPTQIFSDWVEMVAISLRNACHLQDALWRSWEDRYMAVAGRYSGEEIAAFCEVGGMLVMALQEQTGDVLGSVFMEVGASSNETGQFFTPYHVSTLMAELRLGRVLEEWDRHSRIRLLEPSCGAGGMVIAAASMLERRGLPYQKILRVAAQDLDWRSVYMCYVQLSLLGIDAVCVQGDSLTAEKPDKRSILETPAHMLGGI